MSSLAFKGQAGIACSVLSLNVRFIVKLLVQSPFVERVFPFRDNHSGHAVADQIGECARLRQSEVRLVLSFASWDDGLLWMQAGSQVIVCGTLRDEAKCLHRA